MPDNSREFSRRELLTGGFFPNLVQRVVLKTLPLSNKMPINKRQETKIKARSSFLFRPPGACSEEEFLQKCTQCEDCIKVCPPQIIKKAPDAFGKAKGTPMLKPLEDPCLMCAELPCISACDTGALSLRYPSVMGTATINKMECLAHRNEFCSICQECCPVLDAIFVIEGKPFIREEHCTGCGICFDRCPAPGKAILIIPANRESRKSQ